MRGKALYVQVLVGIGLGILIGWLWPKVGVSLEPVGTAFVNLMKLTIAPIVFCTVSGGIAQMADLKKFGRVGGKAILYFEAVSTFALVLGLVVAAIVGPGRGFTSQGDALSPDVIAGFVHKGEALTFGAYLLGLIPDSFFSPFATGNLLQVVLMAMLTGFALTRLGEFGTQAAHSLEKVSKVFFEMIRILIRLAPIGAFGAMAFTVGKFGPAKLLNLGELVGTFYLTSLLFVFVVLGLVARLAGFSIFKFVRYIGEELLVVLGASSSESVLPQLMVKLEKLGVAKPVVRVVVPTGYSFNLDGTNIYMTLATLFLAQANNITLTPVQLITLLLVSMLTSKGASGVAGAGFITLAATLSAVPAIPVTSLAMIYGVDRFMSECRALTNTVGNGVASIVVARWDGQLDQEQLARELNSGGSVASAAVEAP